MTGTDPAECSWSDSYVAASLLTGIAAFGSGIQRVVSSSCKLNAVNVRAAELFDVVFENCALIDVDFSQAVLNRVSFPGSTLEGVHLAKASMTKVDLRDAAGLDLASGYESLRGRPSARRN
ncbi:pentapeptide repeat-containing protein [Nocardiopsis ansamitocini]|nr:pentapeptide repeat-containing protein [Nocardiopsis ansamitocini]